MYLDELSQFKAKQSKILSSSLLYTTGTWVYATTDMASMAKEGYASNPDVYSCIVLKQKAVSGIPIQVLKVATDGTTSPVTEPTDPLKALMIRPNPQESWPKFAEHLVGDLDHAGNAFIERVGPEKSDKTKPREINLLPPAEMVIKRGNARQPVQGYKWGGDVDFKPWQILHLKYYNPLNYFYGLSPLSAAAHAIDQNNAAANWNYALFKNAGRPSGILTLAEEVIDETSYDDIVDKLRKQYTGESKAGQVMVLTGDMKWTTTSFSPVDMDFRNMVTVNTRHIASCFGIPPQLIGEESSKTYSNYSEARQALYKETVLPLMDWLVAELTNWLAPLYGGNYKLMYDKSAIEAINEDTNARYDRILRAVMGGVLTPNEGRKALGYPPVPNGDQRLIPWNLAPEGQVSQMAVQRGVGGAGQQGQQAQPQQQNPLAPKPEPTGQPQPHPTQPQAGRPPQLMQPAAKGNITKTKKGKG